MTPPSATMIHQSSGKIISFMTPGRKVAFGSDIEYIPCFIESEMATSILKKLVDTTQWSQPELNIFGRTRKVPRLAAWYGDQGAIYCYSRLKNKPLEWNSSLLILKELVEKYVEHSFNSVLLNLYRSGADSMSWHQDNEPELGQHPVIASISLGGIRRVVLRHLHSAKTRIIECKPGHGSLIVMRGSTQKLWQHAVPKTMKTTEPRLNLTFRFIDIPS
jgi:alkylated DNA repair dioxygenase AlkB|tara:strand:+ start:845 stop:1498 length:654 start_codon:yes stop_codon:yes gene_type:complete